MLPGALSMALQVGSGLLEEATLNMGLAMLGSMQRQTEMQALLAVEVIAAGFSGLRFLRQSQTEDYINVYGNHLLGQASAGKPNGPRPEHALSGRLQHSEKGVGVVFAVAQGRTVTNVGPLSS
jgi:hypothetical protein